MEKRRKGRILVISMLALKAHLNMAQQLKSEAKAI